jgi:hypothetical protein
MFLASALSLSIKDVQRCAVANRKLHMDAKVIQAGRFDQKTSAAERKRILEELVKKDAVC